MPRPTLPSSLKVPATTRASSPAGRIESRGAWFGAPPRLCYAPRRRPLSLLLSPPPFPFPLLPSHSARSPHSQCVFVEDSLRVRDERDAHTTLLHTIPSRCDGGALVLRSVSRTRVHTIIHAHSTARQRGTSGRAPARPQGKRAPRGHHAGNMCAYCASHHHKPRPDAAGAF